MFASRGSDAIRSCSNPGFQGDWLAPGGHGLDDLQVDGESDHTMLAIAPFVPVALMSNTVLTGTIGALLIVGKLFPQLSPASVTHRGWKARKHLLLPVEGEKCP
jgi:hypothetical protein